MLTWSGKQGSCVPHKKESAGGQGRVISPAPTDATCSVHSCIPVPAIVGNMMLEVILGTVNK